MANKNWKMELEFSSRGKNKKPTVSFTGDGLAKTGEDKAFDEFRDACLKYCASLIADGN